MPITVICRDKLDVVFIVDSSGSINEKGVDNWSVVKNFLNEVLVGMDIGLDAVRVGLVEFSMNALLIFDLIKYNNRADMVTEIDAMVYMGGTTNLADGMTVARADIFNRDGNRPDVPDIAVIVTDGKPTEKIKNNLPSADSLKQRGVRIVCVGITDAIDEDELKAIASSPQDVLLTPNFVSLKQEAVSVLGLLCPANGTAPQPVTVTIKPTTPIVKTPSPPTLPPVTPPISTPATTSTTPGKYICHQQTGLVSLMMPSKADFYMAPSR